MTFEITDKIVKIISSRVLTPVIYMIENGDMLDFICFCDRNITMQEIYDAEQEIREETGRAAQIIDIREFGESERLEIVNNAMLVYSEHPLIEKVFRHSMMEDFKIAMEERKDVLARHKMSGTVYFQ